MHVVHEQTKIKLIKQVKRIVFLKNDIQNLTTVERMYKLKFEALYR